MSSPGPGCRVRAWSDPAQPAVLNHKERPRPRCGESCRYPSRSAGCVRAGSACCLDRREATDLTVTQAVVDEAEHLGGRSGAAVVAPSPPGVAAVVALDLVPAVVAADGLH